jgi:Kef-type K+ transport system membrane component KefB
MMGRDALTILLLQIVVILAVAKLTAALVKRAGQPAVVGEMLGGILLGPSCAGWLVPTVHRAVFAPEHLGALQLLSQIGVILYMFLVGCDLDLTRVRRNARAAVLVSYMGIAVPMLLGIALSWVIFQDYAPDAVRFPPFALFVGTAMSVTAFPVLARIIAERRMTHTMLGTAAIACAAVGDVTAWCILSVVVAIANASGLGGAAMTVAFAVAFTVVMIAVARPLVSRVAVESQSPGDGVLVGALVFAFASAFVTQAIGIHAIFGAFLAGVVVSASKPVRTLVAARVDALASAALVPLFFASAGLRTELTLLSSAGGWLVCAVIIVVAIAGKIGGGAMAARWTAMSWRDSLALGALMNTRGLMELIVLNVGYDLGILSPALYSMMVLMALVTTGMTAPLLSLFHRPGSQTAVRSAV